jgi:hypothetical protein
MPARLCIKYYATVTTADTIVLSLEEKAVEATKQKEEKREKTKPREHEGMPQHHHCPLAKHHGDKNP